MASGVIGMSAKAEARLRKPRTRGSFMPIDAARRQLGLLSVADGAGQCRIYWLVDLATRVIEDSRFLAFGSLASHALADVFTESVRGRTVSDACRLTVEQIEALLRDDPATPALAEDALAAAEFIGEVQILAEAELPRVTLLTKPAETPVYQRKRKQDWTAVDEAWLPLSLLKKIARVDALAEPTLRQRMPGMTASAGGSPPPGVPSYSITGLHDDFRVVIEFSAVAADQVPTLARFLEDALRGGIHPLLTVDATLKPPKDAP